MFFFLYFFVFHIQYHDLTQGFYIFNKIFCYSKFKEAHLKIFRICFNLNFVFIFLTHFRMFYFIFLNYFNIFMFLNLNHIEYHYEIYLINKTFDFLTHFNYIFDYYFINYFYKNANLLQVPLTFHFFYQFLFNRFMEFILIYKSFFCDIFL